MFQQSKKKYRYTIGQDHYREYCNIHKTILYVYNHSIIKSSIKRSFINPSYCRRYSNFCEAGLKALWNKFLKHQRKHESVYKWNEERKHVGIIRKPQTEKFGKKDPSTEDLGDEAISRVTLFEKLNIKYAENMYKEILLCKDVLYYNEQQVDEKLKELYEGLKTKTNDIDPYILCESNLNKINSQLYDIIKMEYKNLNEFTTYMYTHRGKGFRILIGILLRNILSLMDSISEKRNLKDRKMTRLIQKKEIRKLEKTLTYLTDSTKNRVKLKNTENEREKGKGVRKTESLTHYREKIFENQSKIIAASEIVHMGSLLHDDVIDSSDYRRKTLALHKKYNTKISVLSGDFLFGRAGSIFASVGSPDICRIFSYIVESLIKGEFLQVNLQFKSIEEAINVYLVKSFHKTAALISHLFACIAILACKNEHIVQLCFQLGLHVGMAFQLYDDYLDFTLNEETQSFLLQDLKNNIKTAPVLFSYWYYPEKVLHWINKKYLTQTEIDEIFDSIQKSNGLKKNLLCTLLHLKKATDILSLLLEQCKIPKCNAQILEEKQKMQDHITALTNLVFKILSRSSK